MFPFRAPTALHSASSLAFLALALAILLSSVLAQTIDSADKMILDSLCTEILGGDPQFLEWGDGFFVVNSSISNTTIPSPCARFCDTQRRLQVCARNGKVTYMERKGAFFYNGTLPAIIGDLSQLEELRLPGVGFQGSIPSSLSKLNALIRLDLQQNRFSGELPQFPAFIETISVQRNELVGDIPDSLAKLKRLKLFQAHDNRLVGDIPCDNRDCWPALETFLLGSNQLVTGVPAEFGSRPSLDSLRLNQNKFIMGCVSGIYPFLNNDLSCDFKFLGNRDLCACDLRNVFVSDCVTDITLPCQAREWRSFAVLNVNSTQVLPRASFKIFIREGGRAHNISWLLTLPKPIVPEKVDIMGPVPKVDINFYPFLPSNSTLAGAINTLGTVYQQESSSKTYWAGHFNFPFVDGIGHELCSNRAYVRISTSAGLFRANLNVSCSWFPQCIKGYYRPVPAAIGCLDLDECKELSADKCPNCVNFDKSYACIQSSNADALKEYWTSLKDVLDRESHFLEFTGLSRRDFSSFSLENDGTLLVTLSNVDATQTVDTTKLQEKFNSRLPLAPSFEFKADVDQSKVIRITPVKPNWIVIVSVTVPLVVVIVLLSGGLAFYIFRLRRDAMPDPWYFTFGKDWSPMDKGVYTKLVKDHEKIHDFDMMVKFQNLWDKMNGRQFEVVSVTAVYNESLKTAFRIYCDNRIRRMKTNPGLFSSRDWERTDPEGHRKWLNARFGEFVDRFNWNHGFRTDLKSPVIPAVQVTSPSIAVSVARRGFAHGSGLIQQGDYGAGFYFSTFPEYVAFADSNDPIETTLLLCLISPGNPYPTTEQPSKNVTASRRSVDGDESTKKTSLKGAKIQNPKYQSHFVALSGGADTGMPYHYDESDYWDEIVVDQDSQILPAFLVTVQKNSLSKPDIDYNDAKFLSYQSTFDARATTSDDLRGLLLPGFASSSSPLLESDSNDYELSHYKPGKGGRPSLLDSNDIL